MALSDNHKSDRHFLFARYALCKSIWMCACSTYSVKSDRRTKACNTVHPQVHFIEDLADLGNAVVLLSPHQNSSRSLHAMHLVNGTTASSIFGKHDAGLLGNSSTIDSADNSMVPLTNSVYEFIVSMPSEIFTEYNLAEEKLYQCTAGKEIKPLDATKPWPRIQHDASVIPKSEEYLILTDGGHKGTGIPILPLLTKAREVDVMFAAGAHPYTSDNWPTGIRLVENRKRAALCPDSFSFPLVAPNLASRPTFFGCNSTAPTPMIIYLPNRPPHWFTHTSATQRQYS
ncbi:hypothetical protein OE88DRAFT_1644802 [Heliocybe sulcata]|uniref:Lysophospholipase n=1 Tax=Heliocybe sulcata TaxID=5364 RepID=A0A5C3N4F9_9AGAM|nr:hypothetical protein OE88DRAFT_1644802 [Heliocybe sulcata]